MGWHTTQGDHVLSIEAKDGKVVFTIKKRYDEPVEIKFSPSGLTLKAIAKSLFDAYGASPPSGLDTAQPNGSNFQEDRFAAALTRAGLTFARSPSVKLGYRVKYRRWFCFPDFVFADPGWVAVFFDGCYYHHCPEHYPYSAARPKRDGVIDEALARGGWEVVRVWEHEDFDVAAARVAAIVHKRIEVNTPKPALLPSL